MPFGCVSNRWTHRTWFSCLSWILTISRHSCKFQRLRNIKAIIPFQATCLRGRCFLLDARSTAPFLQPCDRKMDPLITRSMDQKSLQTSPESRQLKRRQEAKRDLGTAEQSYRGKKNLKCDAGQSDCTASAWISCIRW